MACQGALQTAVQGGTSCLVARRRSSLRARRCHPGPHLQRLCRNHPLRRRPCRRLSSWPSSCTRMQGVAGKACKLVPSSKTWAPASRASTSALLRRWTRPGVAGRSCGASSTTITGAAAAALKAGRPAAHTTSFGLCGASAPPPLLPRRATHRRRCLRLHSPPLNLHRRHLRCHRVRQPARLQLPKPSE